MAQCAWFSAGNLSFEAVGKMSWRQAHDIMSLDGLTSSARAALQNSAALLQQKGFVGDVEARAGSECEFWQGWLARATLSEDEDVQKLTDQVRIWARRAAPSTLLTPITNPPQKERPISYLKKMFSKRSPD
jgi:hypothetical protein